MKPEEIIVGRKYKHKRHSPALYIGAVDYYYNKKLILFENGNVEILGEPNLVGDGFYEGFELIPDFPHKFKVLCSTIEVKRMLNDLAVKYQDIKGMGGNCLKEGNNCLIFVCDLKNEVLYHERDIDAGSLNDVQTVSIEDAIKILTTKHFKPVKVDLSELTCQVQENGDVCFGGQKLDAKDVLKLAAEVQKVLDNKRG